MSRNFSNKQKLTNFIKSKSIDLGFISCGISKADFLEDEAANGPRPTIMATRRNVAKE